MEAGWWHIWRVWWCGTRTAACLRTSGWVSLHTLSTSLSFFFFLKDCGLHFLVLVKSVKEEQTTSKAGFITNSSMDNHWSPSVLKSYLYIAYLFIPYHISLTFFFLFNIWVIVSLYSMWLLNSSSQLANRVLSQLLAIYFHWVVKKKRLFSIFFSTHITPNCKFYLPNCDKREQLDHIFNIIEFV